LTHSNYDYEEEATRPATTKNDDTRRNRTRRKTDNKLNTQKQKQTLDGNGPGGRNNKNGYEQEIRNKNKWTVSQRWPHSNKG
jgi:ribosome assembly protein YihI (activator of Der GTPase)